MATGIDDPYNRSRDAYVDAMGLRRGALLLSLAANVALAGGIGVTGTLAWWEGRQGAGRIERHILRVDTQGMPLGEVPLDKNWRPSDGDFIGFARRWIKNLRSRPLDEREVTEQRIELRDTTDRRLWQQVGQILRRLDKVQTNAAIDIESIEAGIFDRRSDGTALISVRWVERIRGATGEPQTWSAPLTLRYSAPRTEAEYGANPVGIFVTDFQNTQVQESGR